MTDIADVRTTTTSVVSLPAPADPAPLGLAAFALTTFLLSAKNANLTNGTDAWLGYAFFYGGAVQLLAGMWEFRNRNVFGATAFGTYGGFWLGLGLYVLVVNPHAHATNAQTANDLAWILLGFLLVNTYLLLWSAFVNMAVFAVFLTLEVTELLLVIGNFRTNMHILHAGGWVGIVTAGVAWFASSAILINSMTGRTLLPVGRGLTVRPSPSTPGIGGPAAQGQAEGPGHGGGYDRPDRPDRPGGYDRPDRPDRPDHL